MSRGSRTTFQNELPKADSNETHVLDQPRQNVIKINILHQHILISQYLAQKKVSLVAFCGWSLSEQETIDFDLKSACHIFPFLQTEKIQKLLKLFAYFNFFSRLIFSTVFFQILCRIRNLSHCWPNFSNVKARES